MKRIRLIRISLGLALFFLFVAGNWISSGNANDFILFVGRFHPLTVHFPIAILVLALSLEVAQRVVFPSLKFRFTGFLFTTGAWFAVLAVVIGQFLALSGVYDSDTLYWHKLSGIAVAVLAIVASVLKKRRETLQGRVLNITLVLMTAGLLIGSHLGGTLTHGAGYLTEYLPLTIKNLLAIGTDASGIPDLSKPDKVIVYPALIQPIFAKRCAECHNDDRKEGELSLDTAAQLMEGGENGDAVIPGKASESPLMKHIWKPLSDDDHMPPRGKPQLTPLEAELLHWWIDAGASFDEPLSKTEMPPAIHFILNDLGMGEIKKGIFALEVPYADSSTISRVRNMGFNVKSLSAGTPFLEVSIQRDRLGDALPQFQKLALLSSQIAWLHVDNMPVSKEMFTTISKWPHLTRLHLEHAKFSASDISLLTELKYLTYINLYDTAIVDSNLLFFQKMPALRELYLWQTNVTEQAVHTLKINKPELNVILGASFVKIKQKDTP